MAELAISAVWLLTEFAHRANSDRSVLPSGLNMAYGRAGLRKYKKNQINIPLTPFKGGILEICPLHRGNIWTYFCLYLFENPPLDPPGRGTSLHYFCLYLFENPPLDPPGGEPLYLDFCRCAIAPLSRCANILPVVIFQFHDLNLPEIDGVTLSLQADIALFEQCAFGKRISLRHIVSSNLRVTIG